MNEPLTDARPLEKFAGARLKAIRESAGLSQTEMIDRLGLGKPWDIRETLAAVERGRRNLTLTEAAQIARRLGLPLYQWLRFGEDEDPDTRDLIEALRMQSDEDWTMPEHSRFDVEARHERLNTKLEERLLADIPAFEGDAERLREAVRVTSNEKDVRSWLNRILPDTDSRHGEAAATGKGIRTITEVLQKLQQREAHLDR